MLVQKDGEDDPLPERLKGVIAPVLTPFREDLSVDTGRFVAFCKRLLEEGCHAILPFGTTSEASSLSLDERLEMLDALIEAGVPGERLLVGTGTCALPETVRLSRAAVEHGASGILLLPPFYFKDVPDEGLYASTVETIQRVGESRLRIYLYHIPQVAQVGWSLPLVERLMADFPGTVVGLKDSSEGFDYSRALLSRYPGFGLFLGDECYLREALEMGAAGTITALANVNAPALRRLYDGWSGKRGEERQAAVSAVRRLADNYPLIQGMKAIMAHRTGDPAWLRVRPPLMALPEDQAAKLNSDLDALTALARPADQ